MYVKFNRRVDLLEGGCRLMFFKHFKNKQIYK